MIKSFIPTCILISLVHYVTIAQNQTKVFTLTQYLEQVKTNHPISYQANLINDLVDANSLRAKGGFDPKIEMDYDQKSFDNKNYFRDFNGSLKIPTWFGIDLKAGYNRNSGEFINNSDFLPPRGIWNAGISIPLGKGLIIDERRAELQKAEIFDKSSIEEQRMLLNQLIFDASVSYQEWQMTNEILSTTRDGLEIAKNKFEATKNSYFNGDKPAIDTLEALIAMQTMEQALMQANQENQNRIIRLQNFLWEKGYIPLEIEENISPERLNIFLLSDEIDSVALVQDIVVNNIPELNLYNLKIEGLELEKKLNTEDLKPDLRLSYNPLLGTDQNTLFRTFNANDFKLGANFSYPILIRKERGKLAMTKIKIKDSEYFKDFKRTQIVNKLNEYYNNKGYYFDQVELLENTIENYSKMVDAENERFMIGESSFFLVNSREMKRYEAKLKLIETKFKTLKNNLSYLYKLGLLNELL